MVEVEADQGQVLLQDEAESVGGALEYAKVGVKQQVVGCLNKLQIPIN